MTRVTEITKSYTAPPSRIVIAPKAMGPTVVKLMEGIGTHGVVQPHHNMIMTIVDFLTGRETKCAPGLATRRPNVAADGTNVNMNVDMADLRQPDDMAMPTAMEVRDIARV